MRGGIPFLTLPAGYLGSSFIGAALIACSFDIRASKVFAISESRGVRIAQFASLGADARRRVSPRRLLPLYAVVGKERLAVSCMRLGQLVWWTASLDIR